MHGMHKVSGHFGISDEELAQLLRASRQRGFSSSVCKAELECIHNSLSIPFLQIRMLP